jgi:hypothetical protein
MFVNREPVDESELALFERIPAELIHDMGIVVLTLVFLAGLAGIVTMVHRVAPASGIGWRGLGNRAGLGRIGRALWTSLAIESLGQRRYRVESDAAGSARPEPAETAESAGPVYLRPWFLHMATMLGFLGLLLATTLDYGLDIVGIRETGEPVPIWYPVRLLGTVAGLVMM